VIALVSPTLNRGAGEVHGCLRMSIALQALEMNFNGENKTTRDLITIGRKKREAALKCVINCLHLVTEMRITP